MNYQKIYDQLIEKRKKEIPEGYKENHHILPECMGGSDKKENMVYLSAREHFIAHWLLAKIYDGTYYGYKLASAFQLMTRDQNHKERYKCSQRKYDIARKLFSSNHPCKTEEVKNKIRLRMIQTGKSRSPEEIEIEKQERNQRRIQKEIEKQEKAKERDKKREAKRSEDKERKRNERKEKSLEKGQEKNKTEERICSCGCERSFNVKISSQKRFFSMKCSVTEEYKQKLSMLKTEQLSKLTTEQLQERSKKQFGVADHRVRGEKISLQKRGKKTDQHKLEIEKYGKMSQEEFDNHVKDRNPRIRTRMINKRNAYNGNDSIRVSLFED